MSDNVEALGKLQVQPHLLLSDRQDWLKSLQLQAPEKTRPLRQLWADSFRQQLQRCRARAVEVLSDLGAELAKELEAALFLQLGDLWAADCVKEDVEDTMHVRRCKGCLCFASGFPASSGETPATLAQRLVAGFPAPPPKTPPVPPAVTPATQTETGEDVIEDFEDIKVEKTPKAAPKRRGARQPKAKAAKGGKKRKLTAVASEPSGIFGQSQVAFDSQQKDGENYLWQSSCGLSSGNFPPQHQQQKCLQRQVSDAHNQVPNRQDVNLWMKSQGSMRPMNPHGTLPPQHDQQKCLQPPVFHTQQQGPFNGPDANVCIQSQGSMPPMNPHGNLPPPHSEQNHLQPPVFHTQQQGPFNGPDANVCIQSQGSMLPVDPHGNLPPPHSEQKHLQPPVFHTQQQGPFNGPDANVCIQSQGSMLPVDPHGNLPSPHSEQNHLQPPVFHTQQQGPFNGPDANICIQSQWSTLPMNPHGTLPPHHDQKKCLQPQVSHTHNQVPANGPDVSLWMKSPGSMPPMNPHAALPPENKSLQAPVCTDHGEGNLWMHPQLVQPQNKVPLPAFKTPVGQQGMIQEDAVEQGCAPDAADVPLPSSWKAASPAPMTPIRTKASVVPPNSAQPVASPAARRLTNNTEVLAEISRILGVPGSEKSCGAFAQRWAREVLRLDSGAQQGQAAKAFRRIAREIHPDGRSKLSEEDELRCHEALAQLQRARRRLSGAKPPKRPERLRCEVRNGAWHITWRRDEAVRYELRVQDGSFLVTVAELDVASEASCFELQLSQLSARLRQVLQANGWLGIRVAALNGHLCTLSDEATLWLRELTEAGSKLDLDF